MIGQKELNQVKLGGYQLDVQKRKTKKIINMLL